MNALRIVWKRQALLRVDEIATWYEDNMGAVARHNFLQGISSTVQILSCQPNIGTIDSRRSTKQFKYHSFVAHPKYKIVYYFNSRSLYIVTIYRTLMKQG